MARAKKRIRTEEEYLHYVEAMDLEPSDFESYRALRSKLARQLGITEEDVTAGHIGGAWRAYEDIYMRMAKVGIKPRIVHYAWGSKIRFAIPGMRGWYSWDRAKEAYGVLSGEEW